MLSIVDLDLCDLFRGSVTHEVYACLLCFQTHLLTCFHQRVSRLLLCFPGILFLRLEVSSLLERFCILLLYLCKFLHRFLLLLTSVTIGGHLTLFSVHHKREFVNLLLVTLHLIIVILHHRVMFLFGLAHGDLCHLYLACVPSFCFTQFLFLGIALLT